jgi:hypothetical protein
LRISSFAAIRPGSPLAMRRNATSGVLPTVPVIEATIIGSSVRASELRLSREFQHALAKFSQLAQRRTDLGVRHMLFLGGYRRGALG